MNITGKIWLIKNQDNQLIDNIDTDQIFHNNYLTITDRNLMGKYTFSNLHGWKDFSIKVADRSILIVGENFGQGSSRQQAVDCFISVGIKLIIAKSFGAIYWRNAMNSGLYVLKAPEIDRLNLEDGDELSVSILDGEIHDAKRMKKYRTKPLSDVELNILESGGLFNYARSILKTGICRQK